MKKKILLSIWMILLIFHFLQVKIYANTNEIFVFNDIATFPLGWNTKTEILDAYKKLEIKINDIFVKEGNVYKFISPLNGVIKIENKRVVIENDGYRIIYPKLFFSNKDFFKNRMQHFIRLGEKLFSLNEKYEKKIIVFLCNPNMNIPYLDFKNKSLSFYVERKTNIFSINDGIVWIEIHNLLGEEIKHLTIGSDYEIEYNGFEMFLIENNQKVTIGDLLGSTVNKKLISIKIIEMPFGTIEPSVIYIEVL